MQRVRESLTLFLIAMLPLHALLVTVGTKIFMGPLHAPWGVFALWKEGVLGAVLVLALWEIFIKLKIKNYKLKIYVLDWLIIGMVCLGVLTSIINYQLSIINYVYGFKYTLFPLCLFLILRRVDWSDGFKKRVLNIILIVGSVVAGYGIITFFLPAGFFSFLGYSDLHSLYVPDGPLASFQQIGGSGLRRIQSTMSGPNQLGVWLLIPLGVCLMKWKNFLNPHPVPLPKGEGTSAILVLIVGALLLTFSRSAWVGAGVMMMAAMLRSSDSKIADRNRSDFRIASTVGGVIVVLGIMSFLHPDVLFRIASTRGHIEKPLEAIQVMVAHPLGLGLGSSGPASNRVSDTCVYLEKGADTSWAQDRPDLCVFAGDIQVQPETPCSCPFLPENWYLQVGTELGIAGFILFFLLVLLVLRSLQTSDFRLQTSVFLSFLGISITALFLHSWESSAVAYTMWILLAMMVPCIQKVSSSSILEDNTRI